MEKYRIKFFICIETLDERLELPGTCNIIPAIGGTIGNNRVKFHQMDMVSHNICQCPKLKRTCFNILRQQVGKPYLYTFASICPDNKRLGLYFSVWIFQGNFPMYRIFLSPPSIQKNGPGDHANHNDCTGYLIVQQQFQRLSFHPEYDKGRFLCTMRRVRHWKQSLLPQVGGGFNLVFSIFSKDSQRRLERAMSKLAVYKVRISRCRASLSEGRVYPLGGSNGRMEVPSGNTPAPSSYLSKTLSSVHIPSWKWGYRWQWKMASPIIPFRLPAPYNRSKVNVS